MLKDLLQGKLLGHPLHSILIHFPIGLLYLSLLLDVIALAFDGGNVIVRASFYTLLFAAITALLAAVPGLVDRAGIRDDHPAKKTANTHMILNIAAVGFTILGLILRYAALNAETIPIASFLMNLLAVALVSYSGYLGGALVYGDGIGVGRHRRLTATPEITLRPTTAETIPAQSTDSVAIAQSGALDEGETLRASVDGVVITVARVQGQLYAFQEFCTHRYGPLSEGAFQDHQVICPWHLSCFDIRTGEVTQGPAKLDLKTYPVSEQNGWIHITPTASG